MNIWLGCGGYSNDDWMAEGLIYSGVRKDNYLQVYAEHFAAVELNSSFYAIPGVKAFEGMVRRIGERDFRMAVKLNKVFTHDRAPTDADVDRMLQSPEPLREAGMLGPYLAQFPYSFHRTRENRLYLARLTERFAGHELAVELRHASWDIPEVREGMEEFGLIWVSPDYPPVGGMPLPQVHVTGDVGYLRLHGRNEGTWWEGSSAAERHDYRYSRAEMDEWAEKIALVQTDLSVLYIFFQNTTRGHALHNIPMLREALAARGLSVLTPEIGAAGRLF